METTRPSRLAALYAGTIFVSAFLLFQIQPLISRFILPWFGGTPAVWTTCLVFFQTALFAGYLYAHLSEHYLGRRARTIVHLVLIVAALCTLPITPSDWWKPADSDYPAERILALLAVCVGLPYFLLSSTGPLVQAWFSQTLPGRSPYRLYSLSNLGSLLALLTYPFVVEPLLDRRQQSLCWTGGFVLFAILCAAACWKTARLRAGAEPTVAEASAGAESLADNEPAPSWLRRLAWLLLPAFASVLLLATTNHICLDVPAVPFLWIAPLSLYLLSFIIAFDHERWYRRLPFAFAALFLVYYTAIMQNPTAWGNWWSGSLGLQGSMASTKWLPMLGFWQGLGVQLALLFVLSMLCHGELVRLRPTARYLTSFYLMISAGGALGGLSVSLLAPLVFKTYAEWKIGLIAGFVLAAVVAFVVADWKRLQPARGRRRLVRAGGILVTLIALPDVVYILTHQEPSRLSVLDQTRDFYGVLTVMEGLPAHSDKEARLLSHGSTLHGMQFTDSALRDLPTTYFSRISGVGRTLRYYQDTAAHGGRALRVGVIGLGTGTLAAWISRPGQTIRFYEIDPEVLRLAEKYFTYLEDARDRGAGVEIVLGDARLSLERDASDPLVFDVLVLDAFSSDSPPIHLLTTEAFEIYAQHLAPEGAIAVNVTNRFLNLAPVVYGAAEAIDLEAVYVSSGDIKPAILSADWVILSRDRGLLDELRSQARELRADPQPPFPRWTDQRHNLMEVLKRHGSTSGSRSSK